MSALAIDFPRDGDLLNVHDGRQTPAGLTITVRGTAPPQAQVTIAGLTLRAEAGVWAADVTLTEPVSTLAATCGGQAVAVTVYWDRSTRLRYRYSTDDNIYFLRDLATESYTSLFDQPYLAFWRRLHETYGLKVQHNIYWCEPEGFDLSQMPERYRGEFEDHADWLKLTFHAEQDKPDRPYIDAGYDVLARDFERITAEIHRFAGESATSAFTTIHWAEATFEGCQALRDRGIAGLAGYFITEPQPDGSELPRVAYYHDLATTRHAAGREAFRCHRGGLWFIKHDLVCNGHPPEQIRGLLDGIAANPQRRQIMEVMIHEQYFRSHLRHYQPDAEQRVVECVAWLAEHGYESVFWDDGLLGPGIPVR